MDDDLPDIVNGSPHRRGARPARQGRQYQTRLPRQGARVVRLKGRDQFAALPASPANIAAFLSEERYPAPPNRPLAVNTLKLRAAARSSTTCLSSSARGRACAAASAT